MINYIISIYEFFVNLLTEDKEERIKREFIWAK